MSDQKESAASAQNNFLSRIRQLTENNKQSILRVSAILGLALIVLFVMRNFSSDVQLDREASLLATAEALALPTIQSLAGGPANSLLPLFAGGAYNYADGIPRYASIDTIVPNRPRVDLDLYTVEQGDNLFGIAAIFGITPESVLWANLNVLDDNPNFLQPGQVLNIMPTNGTLHNYRAGESLEDIADFYGTDAIQIVEWAGNYLDPFDTQLDDPQIPDGTLLIVPDGSRELKDWGPPAITRENPAVAAYYGGGACGAIYEGAVGNGTFVWPTVATNLSGFDYNPPLHPALDIAGAEGNAIFTVDSGVVVYAGWSDSGYGNLLVIDHGNGWQSAYAHLVTIAVNCGQSVSQGEVVAGLGNTGNSSGAHLHFELYSSIYGKVNPWNYLIQ
jgi:murein DD-endopeptidase MepM/ murein hydrolase activator NlpD